MATEPPASPWDFGDPATYSRHDDVIGLGADLAPGTLLAAYRQGIFPMPSEHGGQVPAWFCPVRRGVLPLDRMRVTRSLAKSERRFEVRVDTAFEEVIGGCADESRSLGWIDDDIHRAYVRLHELGWAHSVETWRDGELVGGLYGVAIGGLFAGESMFFRERDASKVALAALVDLLRSAPAAADRVLDVQWLTPHLASLGAVEVDRATYLRRLQVALRLPLPGFSSGPLERSKGGSLAHPLDRARP